MKNRILLLAVGFLLTCSLFIPNKTFAQNHDVETSMLKYGRLMKMLETYYVDSVNVTKLTEDAIVKVLSELDPHSVYISKDEVERMNEPLKGSFEGIGISFNIYKDTLLVVTTIPGGPSEKVGLMAGDRIVAVDGKNIAGIGLKNSDVFDMLRGDKGTEVHLQVQRNNKSKLLDFTIVRDKIPIYSVDATYMLNKKTGYLKLNRFSETTIEEVDDALRKLKKHKDFDQLILDLRGNGGGLLRAAIGLADQFLKNNELVVYTKGLHSQRQEYRSSSLGEFEKGKLIVLIDEGSASASEIVTGAIQDWDRGVVVGRRSFGKGLVQQPFSLMDGSVVRLTVAHYYTPSGRCIQKPYNNGLEAYEEDYLNRYKHGELFNQDSIHLDKSQLFHTLTSNRKVYGGGGIMPDLFVPVDTSMNYRYYNLLIRNNIVYPAVLGYLDQNRKELIATYPTFQKYNKEFVFPKSAVDSLMNKGESKGIKSNDKEKKIAFPLIQKQAKAIIARDLFGSDQFYEVINSDDDVIKRALDLFKDPTDYERILKGE